MSQGRSRPIFFEWNENVRHCVECRECQKGVVRKKFRRGKREDFLCVQG